MNIKETIAVINQMRADDQIGQYAIGGAVAATFYLEPIDTQDVDVFISLEAPAGQSLVSIAPIYAYLQALGHQVNSKGDVVISGWPVQFLPVGGNPLLKEALEHSVLKDIDGVPVQVFSAEYLMAIALGLGRAKDKLRLTQFLESSPSTEPKKRFDETLLDSILQKHDLSDQWARFKRQMSL